MNKQQLLSTPVRHKSLCVLPAGQSFGPPVIVISTISKTEDGVL